MFCLSQPPILSASVGVSKPGPPLTLVAAITTVCALVFGSSSQMAIANEITFQDAFSLALSNAPDYQLAEFKVVGAKARRDQALGKLLPQVSLFGQWSQNEIKYDRSSDSYADVDFPGQRYGVTLNQSLVAVADGLELNRMNLLQQLSQEELREAEADLLDQVLTAYLTVLISDADIGALESEIAAIDIQLEESRALYSENLIPITAVLEAESRRASLYADLAMAQGQRAVAREALTRLTGEREFQLVEVSESIGLLSTFGSANAAASAALISDPAIASARTSVSAAEKAVLREKSRWIPDVSLNYSFQHSDVGFDNQRVPSRDTSTLALQFQYPIFEGGAKRARMQGVTAEYNAATTALRAQKLDTESRARSAWLSFHAGAERLRAGRQAFKSSSVNVDATELALKAGKATRSDILFALAQKTRARRDLIDARFFYVQAWVELELCTGAHPGSLAERLSAAMHL